MKYKSCRLLEHGVYFHLDPENAQLCVGHCCNSDNQDFDKRLYIYNDLLNQNLDLSYIFSVKRTLRENAKKGILPFQCEGCFELIEKDWDDSDYISHITAAHIMKCNSRCIYCPIGIDSSCHNMEQSYDFKPFVNELLEKKLLRFDGSLRFVGGEPTLMKEFDWLIDLFSQNNVPEIYVPTSGIKFSKSLSNALKKVRHADIVISVDAGCMSTFEKIKGTKFYNLVLKNIQKYLISSRKKDFIKSKFILFPTYNDLSSEIVGWLKTAKKIGLVEVQFDSELKTASLSISENKKYIVRTLKMLDFAEIVAKNYNINIFSYLAFMNRTKKAYNEQLEVFQQNYKEFIDLHIDDNSTHIPPEIKFSNLYINLDNVSYDFLVEKIEPLIQNSRFSPKRKVFINDSSNVLKKQSSQDKLLYLLRLGFDFEMKINGYIMNPILEEILKTSYSNIYYHLKFYQYLNVHLFFSTIKLSRAIMLGTYHFV